MQSASIEKRVEFLIWMIGLFEEIDLNYYDFSPLYNYISFKVSFRQNCHEFLKSINIIISLFFKGLLIYYDHAI